MTIQKVDLAARYSVDSSQGRALDLLRQNNASTPVNPTLQQINPTPPGMGTRVNILA